MHEADALLLYPPAPSPFPSPCSNRICAKVFGKFKLYWPQQDQYGTMFALGKEYNASDYVRTEKAVRRNSRPRAAADGYAGY